MKKKIDDVFFRVRIASVLTVCVAKIFALFAIYHPERAEDFLEGLRLKFEEMSEEENH